MYPSVKFGASRMRLSDCFNPSLSMFDNARLGLVVIGPERISPLSWLCCLLVPLLARGCQQSRAYLQELYEEHQSAQASTCSSIGRQDGACPRTDHQSVGLCCGSE